MMFLRMAWGKGRKPYLPSLHAVRELLGEIIHASFHRSILIHHVLDGFASVDNGTMIPTPKGIPYLL